MNIDTMVEYIEPNDGKSVLYGNMLFERDIEGCLYSGFVFKNLVFLDRHYVMRILGFTKFDDFGNETLYYKNFHKVFYRSMKSLGLNKEDYPIPFKHYSLEINEYAKDLPRSISELILFEIFKNNIDIDKAKVEMLKDNIINIRAKAIDRIIKKKQNLIQAIYQF